MKKFKLTEDVLIQIIDEQAVIVSPSGGMITTVNETGAFIIRFLKNNKDVTLEELVRVVQAEFDAPKNIITNDVLTFIEVMLTNKIVEKFDI
ncbi:PqqD family protein [Polaribacter sp. Z022]|uniref:PqqD family protein n=1 Tax=Polaribacter sp. Z022 TaxID=2927125 RepID=UPI002020C5A6|nr:PqqD family protein [Polaribacter sp. Z022]MCL7753098.1 PqqD family protein [Polaribacter sp. Z022]